MNASLILTVLLAFFIGAIPFGLVVSKVLGRSDPRTGGSGNFGATNVLRTGGTVPALLTLAGDALKGTLAVWLVSVLATSRAGALPLEAVAAVTVVLGHMFSPFSGFRGGKGVATGTGAFLYLMPGPVAWAAVVFLSAVALTRYVSLGSMLGAVTLPLAGVIAGHPSELTVAAALIAFMVIQRHTSNIRRLLAGEENKIGRKPA